MTKELRDYQQRIVNTILDSNQDLIVCLPTGSGKTVIASGLIEQIPGKVVFVVPRLELIKQAKDEFGTVDVIWSDKTSLENNHCIVASKDSLRLQYEKLPQEIKTEINEGTVIFDEAHVSIKQSYNIVHLLQPKRVIGLTATPERMDGLALLKGTDEIHKYGIFDSLLQAETVPSLQRKGYLSKLRYFACPIEGIADIKPDSKTAEELSGRQMMEIFSEHNIWGDLVKSYEEYGKGRPAIGFTTTIAMGEAVVNLFNDAGYDFRIIHGGMSVKERYYLIELLENREIDGLVNAALLTYGFDCPPVSYAFNCRHIKSRPLWFQIVGRILRPAEGKENAIFVDHADSISEFSDPDCSLPILDETITWRVDGETKEQKNTRKRAMKKVQETMALIQELNPIPAKLVEITTENTWERLVKIIQKLRNENASLFSEKQALESALTKKEEEKQRLITENKKIKSAKEKVIDRDKTFEYIRTHYIPYRKQAERTNPGISKGMAHTVAKNKIINDSYNLDFLFDEARAERSFSWWFENYEKRVKD